MAMPRKTPARQLDLFLRRLAETGNFALAAEQASLAKSGLHKRKARDPEFAATCAAAVAKFRLGAQNPAHPEEPLSNVEAASRRTNLTTPNTMSGFKTAGGSQNQLVLSTYAGKPQLRRLPAGRLTPAGRAALLDALAETASIRAAAAAIGIAHSSILWRAARDPAFGQRLRATAAVARDRRLWERTDPDRHGRPEDWVFNADDRPLPPMTVEQAILQLIFHNPDGRFQRAHWRRRRPPPPLEKVKGRILAKLRAFERAKHFRDTGSWNFPEEE
jgi:hypothetical protein